MTADSPNPEPVSIGSNFDRAMRTIVARASSLDERTNDAFVPLNDSTSNEVADVRIRRWRGIAAGHDAEVFRRRLEWDGLDMVLARRAVGPVRCHPAGGLPRWACTLAETLRLARTRAERERCFDEQEPIPFQDILAPFVAWARLACAREAAEAYTGLPEAAHVTLERQLLEWLAARAARPLLLELSLDVAGHASALDELSGDDPPREGYDAFVARMLQGGLLDFFAEYSALARVLTASAETWVEATVEFLGRLRADADGIRSFLGVRGAVNPVALTTSLSDPHRGFRCVAILTFESGKRLVYKPRPVAIEAQWNSLLAALAALGAPIDFRTFGVLDRGDYGWAEHVSQAPCADDAAARRYVTRCGGLLCIVHWLRGTDCHAENLIATGEHPVLIDVETMLSPAVREPRIGADAPRLARRQVTHSVLETGLLPFWSRSAHDGGIFDGSGFGADAERPAPRRQKWLFVNTDRMQLVTGPQGEIPMPHARVVGGQPIRVFDYEKELVEGFEATYRFLVGAREELLGSDGPLARIAPVPVRFAYRPTAVYCSLLDRLKNPEFLRDGAEKSIEIEQLATASIRGERFDGRVGWKSIWNAERIALERDEVPHFSALAGEDTLSIAPRESVAGWFERSACDAAAERLRGFGDSDLGFQLDVIRSSLRSRAPAIANPTARGLPRLARSGTPRRFPGGADPWIDEATAIANSIARSGIRGSDGSIAWLQPAPTRELMLTYPDREADLVGGDDLGDGAIGIALFLVALDRVTGKSGMRSSALGAVRPILVDLEERGEATAAYMGIGGLRGLGSVVHGLVRMNQLIDDPTLLAGAERAATLIRPESIDATEAMEITSGRAGALLGLLALYEANGSPSALARATRCGRSIELSAKELDRETCPYRVTVNRNRFGFSSGAGGIAYALCYLNRFVGEPGLIDAARVLIDCERRALRNPSDASPEAGFSRIPRLAATRPDDAPGFALSRMACLDYFDDDDARQEIEQALALTARIAGGDGSDHFLSGRLGALETLWCAGRTLSRSELCDQARRGAWEVVLQARERGAYALPLPSAGRLRCYGLCQGMAGIGYALLRFVRPDLLPTLLELR